MSGLYVGGLVFDQRTVHVGFVMYKAAVILSTSHGFAKDLAELRKKSAG